MKVCIAEKPSVARDLAQVLGARSKHDGYYEGNGYQVTWTFGHLCTLLEPHDYNAAWKRWRLEHLPMVPPEYDIKLVDNKGVQKQFSVIARLVTQADEVINCGDAGQEGELIQRWVLKQAACTAPVKRLWISSLTVEAIRDGFANLRPQEDYDRLYAAGSSRAIGDWILGINATRLYTLRYGDGKHVLSVGRVQTPTLAMIVGRELDIERFIPEAYWEVKTTYRDVMFSYAGGKCKSREKAQELLEIITGRPLTIASVEQKKGKELPPKLFDLTALQVECNKRFGFSADRTLKIVQALYEKKLVTYPRVDTTYLPEDLYPKIHAVLRQLKGYADLVEPLLAEPVRKSKKVFDNEKVTDHHAIIPTTVGAGNLAADDAKVYDAIARRFIAAFYPDCLVSKTVVKASVAEVSFKVTGKQIVEPGWRRVLKEIKEKKEEDEQQLPAFVSGESGVHQPCLDEKKTKPPKFYTEATLLRAMETAGRGVDDEELREALKENGIGRPSTRAGIIETLFRRRYIRREKKALRATPAGIALIGKIQFELLKSAELTGQWEKKLRYIEQGEYRSIMFIEEMNTLVQDVTAQVKADRFAARIRVEAPSGAKAAGKDRGAARPGSSSAAVDIVCPECHQGKVIKGKQAYGCSRYKEGCGYRLFFEQYGKQLTDKQLERLLNKGKTGLIKGLLVDGKKAEGKLVLDARGRVTCERRQPDVLQCPCCAAGTVIKGRQAYGCSCFREGCAFRIPFELAGKTLTAAQVKALVTKKRTPVIKGFTRDGVTFSARLGLDDEGRLIRLDE